ncbi:MAG: hypothetical protein EP329_05485 [Deltaproteobacteria bacterium]|nr:MAG: hypothetical protein EP329_05485 [Deltaproteobacteria bacterium]
MNSARPLDTKVPPKVIELFPEEVGFADPNLPNRGGYQVDDHRYGRPSPGYVDDCPYASGPLPWRWTYHGWYSRWYVHPYWRWQYGTYIVIHSGWGTLAWIDGWTPHPRAGWVWMPGYWDGFWHPGYWAPMGAPPRGYVYVPGYWYSDYYVEGYYRSQTREDGDWQWVEGQYLEDGTYVPGHWRPRDPGPEGYTWEPGFWDGEVYVDGFWRPMYRDGFAWQGAYFDADGVYHSGFWKPIEDKAEHVWVPGWFDGNGWQEGYWVHEGVYYSQRPEEFEAPEGWNAGWDVGSGWGDGEVVERHELEASEPEPVPDPAPPVTEPPERPLGIPVE